MNKKTLFMFVLVSVFSLLPWGSHSFGQGWAEFNQPWVEGPVHGYYEPKPWDSLEVSWLIGYRVYSPEGGSLGQISDLVVNKDDGHIVLVILSDVPGFGSRLAAAPWGAFERIGEHTFQLNFGDREVALGEAYRDPYADEMGRNMDLLGLSDVPGKIDSQWADCLFR